VFRGFSDAELAALIAPRALIIEATPGPQVEEPSPARDGRSSGAPGKLEPAPIAAVRAEVERARPTFKALGATDKLTLVEPPTAEPDPGTPAALAAFLHGLRATPRVATIGTVTPTRPLPDPKHRLERQFRQIVGYTQRLAQAAEETRKEFWSKADRSAVENWGKSTEAYRTYFWEEVIGRLPPPSVPLNPRTRKVAESARWTEYEVVLDLWPEAFTYGLLLLPKGMQSGERRPVVVCQHGLNGRAQDTVNRADPIYRGFAARLADRGYVVYANQNPTIFDNTFRWLQRRAHPLKWSLFGIIIAQNQRFLSWLKELPFVDPSRIAFYGLSYGGDTAMRIPAIVQDYCLSITSAVFNQTVFKYTSLTFNSSYQFANTWEAYEFNLGNTFTHADMAGLICPRPFMVERGHRDGVGLDEWVAFEYAKVRLLYVDLKIPERTEIDWFDDGHVINAVKTFPFLDRHLNWTPTFREEKG